MAKQIQGKKEKNPFKKWYSKLWKKFLPKRRAYYRYYRNIILNSKNRILVSILFALGIFALVVVLLEVSRASNMFFAIWASFFFILVSFCPINYIWKNFNQLDYETHVNLDINSLKWRIRSLNITKEKKNYRALQSNIAGLRSNLINYLENSEVVSPPVSNFELNRVKKRIDVFFNCKSEVLVPIDKLFSLSEQRDKEFYGEPPEEDEDFDHYEFGKTYEINQERGMTGEFNEFDLEALDEFLDYLWDVLFDKEIKPYSVYSYKHPVNLILLSKFFDMWNSKIERCENCKMVYKKARYDIEEFYKSEDELESEKRQRSWQLKDNVIVVLVSVGLSTFIQYLIHA